MTYNPKIQPGKQVRRMTPVPPGKMQKYGVVQGGVYQVLERRRYESGDELILGPVWPEEKDIPGRWAIEQFALEGEHLDWSLPGGALAEGSDEAMSERPSKAAPRPVVSTQEDAEPVAPKARKKRSDAGKPRVRKPASKPAAPVFHAVEPELPDTTPDPMQAREQEVQVATSALDEQVGGDHYKHYPPGYQPLEIAEACGLSPLQFSMLKYIMRFPDKGGAQDLDKVIHCAQLAKKIRYNK